MKADSAVLPDEEPGFRLAGHGAGAGAGQLGVVSFSEGGFLLFSGVAGEGEPGF